MVTLTSNVTQAPGQPRGLPEAPLPAGAAARGRQEAAAPGKPASSEAGHRAAGPDEASVTAAVLRLNDLLQHERRTLQFTLDQTSGHVVITITDAETDQVIRQIPAEEVLAIMRHLSEEGLGEGRNRGVLVSERV